MLYSVHMSAVEYLLYYLLVGVTIELWSFRKVIRLVLSRMLSRNPLDTKVRELQNRLHSEILVGPQYISHSNFKVVIVNILFWPLMFVIK